MKQIIFIALIALCVFPTACKKKNNAGPVAPDSTQPYPIYFKTAINGIPWIADSAIGNLITYPNDSTKFNLSFTATKLFNGAGTEIDLYITNYTGVGSYNISPPAVTATYYVNTVRHFATSGVINIDTVASVDTLTGNFNFVADSINVTNGAISIVL